MAALVERLRALRRRPDPAAEVDAIAGITERVAVLLAAGVPASNVWRHLQPVEGESGGGRGDGGRSTEEMAPGPDSAHASPSASADAAVLTAAAQAAAARRSGRPGHRRHRSNPPRRLVGLAGARRGVDGRG